MKLMNRTDGYRLLTLTELGRAFPAGVPAAVVAQRRAIPAPYLSRLVGELARAGLVRARRGPGGGLCLARAPESIVLSEVLGVDDDGHPPPLVGRVEAAIRDAIATTLTAVSVADLVRWDRPAAPDYSI